MGQKLNTQIGAGFQEQREAGGSCLGSGKTSMGLLWLSWEQGQETAGHDLKPPAHPGWKGYPFERTEEPLPLQIQAVAPQGTLEGPRAVLKFLWN